MHIDDIDYVVNSRSSNFVIGLKLSDDKPTVYVNFINPHRYNFSQALRDLCTEASTAATPTKAQANAIAYAHAKTKSLASDTHFTSVSVSVDEHIALSSDNGFLPVIMLNTRRVNFHWFSSAHMKSASFIGMMSVNEILESSAEQVHNRLAEMRDDSIFTDDDNDSHMHYRFWHS